MQYLFSFMSAEIPHTYPDVFLADPAISSFQKKRLELIDALQKQDHQKAIQSAKEGDSAYFFFLVAEDLAREALFEEGSRVDAFEANIGFFHSLMRQVFGLEKHYPLLKAEEDQREAYIAELLEALVGFIFPHQEARQEWKHVLADYRHHRHPERILESPVFTRADEVRPTWDKLRFLWKTDLENHFPISPDLEILFNALEEVYDIMTLVRRGETLPDHLEGRTRSKMREMIWRLFRKA